MVDKVLLTDEAAEWLRRLTEMHGPLMFHQSGGCCDGSAPMCLPAADFPVGAGDIRVGDIEGVPVYVALRELRAWEHRELVIDVASGYADGLSLAPGDGLHFVSGTRLQ